MLIILPASCFSCSFRRHSCCVPSQRASLPSCIGKPLATTSAVLERTVGHLVFVLIGRDTVSRTLAGGAQPFKMTKNVPDFTVHDMRSGRLLEACISRHSLLRLGVTVACRDVNTGGTSTLFKIGSTLSNPRLVGIEEAHRPRCPYESFSFLMGNANRMCRPKTFSSALASYPSRTTHRANS